MIDKNERIFNGVTRNKKGLLGNDLLSQGDAPQVPSALVGLTAGFGMEPGVPPPLKSPRRLFYQYSNNKTIDQDKLTSNTLKTK